MKYRADPGDGDVKLADNSSIRKLMRAARRGKLPPEYLRAIKDANTEEALKRHAWYRRKLALDALRARSAA